MDSSPSGTLAPVTSASSPPPSRRGVLLAPWHQRCARLARRPVGVTDPQVAVAEGGGGWQRWRAVEARVRMQCLCMDGSAHRLHICTAHDRCCWTVTAGVKRWWSAPVRTSSPKPSLRPSHTSLSTVPTRTCRCRCAHGRALRGSAELWPARDRTCRAGGMLGARTGGGHHLVRRVLTVARARAAARRRLGGLAGGARPRHRGFGAPRLAAARHVESAVLAVPQLAILAPCG